CYKKQWHIDPQIKENREEYADIQGAVPGVFVNVQGAWRDHFYDEEPEPVDPAARQDSAYYCKEEAERAFEKTKEYASEHGIRIMNASPGSFLKVFEEVSPEKLLVGDSVDDQMFVPDWERAAEILRSYKNKYEGKRCFIIGNGPSLRAEDLDKIKGEYSFACNLIYLIFGQTEWRPTFHATQDKPVSLEYMRAVSAIPSELKFLAIAPGGRMFRIDGAIPIHIVHNSGYWIQKGTMPPFSDDVAQCVHDGMTVTYINMQLAVYMGFKEIVLLGMDHQFKYQWHISQKVRDNPEEYFDKQLKGHGYEVKELAQDHFCPNYNQIAGGSEDIDSVYCIDEVTLAYMAAREYAKEHGIRILNATRGGKLEVFERVNFDKLMSPDAANATGKDKSTKARAFFKHKKGKR
ncbi:MAG: DUF115 domain-containing protein, partial [Fretibacterium sp.]|nr:DUF115 domain-containing protein [Fretibacterium sp.]